MYRPPEGDEDEQHEYTRTKVQTPNPRQRRRPSSSPVPKEPQPQHRGVRVGYHSDEHPEIPKIRRASRHLMPQEELESVKPSMRMAPETEQDEPRRRYTDKERNGQQASAFQGRSDSTGTDIPTARPRRHTSAQQPPPAISHVQHKRTARPFMARLQHWSYSPVFLIVASITVAIVVLLPIVFIAVHSLPTTPSAGVDTTPVVATPTAGPGIKQAPVDPHELVITPQDTDHPAPPVFATAAYLLDADTGATLYAYNPFMHLPLMSTTKLMTAVLAIERGNLDSKITITAAMANDINQLSADATVFGLQQGETYTLRDLMYALLLKSGNDAAVAIADTIGGNLPKFVALMNQRAQELGLYDTHFMNPHGLQDTGHYSSAHDLAFLGRYSLSLPALHAISATKIYHLPPGNHPDSYVLNGNQFIWWYPGADSGKPGYDGANNFVQVISATRNHHHLIGVTIHTKDWWTDMRDLMNWGFDSFTWISPYDVDKQQAIPFDYAYDYFSGDKKESTVPMADHGRYYIYTGFSISGPIMDYFDKAGGLAKLGYPTGMPKAQQVPSASVVTQQFEHATISCNLANKQCNRA